MNWVHVLAGGWDWFVRVNLCLVKWDICGYSNSALPVEGTGKINDGR
jgi:hypothetical protein